ncbi:uncharacterized protein ASPGLDRAFT_152365 [Aspergillus glaucus CBS 516.65]|uniref:Uncharacterized protein n=1 Tax=Aspergillus glaucus CBS 516.65 TaxID=1160497 RepID=A0A1L9VFQ3_ASPGL|nr:hypothetical protein ASPGLDRAFT_152365 [Aspergillus glaucus CBS 516.65]OJJ82724.1 hypothetical protein ASPGLDRAFT_152365 [Aspergillus glaucus CBS 516.65]
MVGLQKPGVDAWVNYYQPNGSPPSHNDMAILLGSKDMVSHRVRIHDLRPEMDRFSLDANGFQCATLHSQVTDFGDESQIRNVYFKEVEKLIQETTGASRVLVYNHTVRSKPSNEFGDQVKGRYQGIDGPAYRIHVDQTPPGAQNTVRFMFPELADEVNAGNFQLLNVWRPLKKVDRDPLMVADMAALSTDDLITVPRSYYDGLQSSNYVVKYEGRPAVEASDPVTDGLSNGGEHSWWYIDQQEAHEAIIFSCSDLRPSKRPEGTVHGSFLLPDQDGNPPRQSIEVRVIAFF